MKSSGITRSICLLVAGALFSAPSFAQAPTGPAATTGTDPAQTPAAPGTAPAPATGAAPMADNTPAAPEAKKPSDWIDAWAGSSLFVQTGANLNTFLPRTLLSSNPTVETYAIFAPRYRLSKNFQLRGRLPIFFEWTNSDTTTYKNEAQIGDAAVQLFYSGIPAFKGLGTKLKLSPFASVAVPTSKMSRARTLYATPAIGFQLVAPYEKVLGGDAMLIANANYSRPIYNYTTPGVTDDRPYGQQCFSNDLSCGNQLSGVANPRDVLSWSVLGVIEWGNWSPGFWFNMTHTFPYQFSDTPQVTNGNASTGSSLRLADRSSVRQSTYFVLWLDYHANDWLTPEVGYQITGNVLAEDGSYRNPFFSTKLDPVFYLGANIQLDSLYKTIRGQEGQAGVVRAQTKQPIRFY